MRISFFSLFYIYILYMCSNVCLLSKNSRVFVVRRQCIFCLFVSNFEQLGNSISKPFFFFITKMRGLSDNSYFFCAHLKFITYSFEFGMSCIWTLVCPLSWDFSFSSPSCSWPFFPVIMRIYLFYFSNLRIHLLFNKNEKHSTLLFVSRVHFLHKKNTVSLTNACCRA